MKYIPLLFIVQLLWLVWPTSAEQPLNKQVDALIRAKADGEALATKSDDAEFLRRIYLDLAGRIPTVAEARVFLDNKAADKRTKLIDELLASKDYPRRMQELFNAMLMERRGDNEEWINFLRASFEQNLPWDQMARAIVKPDAGDENKRGAAYFFTARLVQEGAMAAVDIPGLTRDMGRLLAGVDLQCAQCHDHVSISDYRQRDFQGLHMIFENVQPRRDVKFPAVSEKIMTAKKDFMSVFEQAPMQTAPVIPGGEEIEIVSFAKGEEYEVLPDRKTRTPGVPKFSPLRELAEHLANAKNDLFCKNIANRLWFVMMGRGLVEPLDLLHSDNPPTHPELLELLAHEFAAHKFDIKWLLRELALTEAYQRTSETDTDTSSATYTAANEKRLSAEQLFWSGMIAAGELEGQNLEKTVAESEDLKRLQKLFTKAYANSPKEPEVDFEPTVKAALFLMHDQSVLDLLEPKDGNLIERLSKIDEAGTVVDELFLTILSRPPTDEDRADVLQYLSDKKERRVDALKHLAWALLSSTEFCVNH